MPRRIHICWAVFTFFFAFVCCAAATEVPELTDGQITGPLGGPKLTDGAKAPFDEIVFVNGFATASAKAVEQAKATGDKLGCGVRLIFNDLTLPGVDHIAIAWDKLFDADVSLNAATETLTARIRAQVESGKHIYIVGFSAGSIVANNAVRSVADGYENRAAEERTNLLGRVHILTVGSAVFADDHDCADGWPKGLGNVFNLYDKKDGIAQFAGPGKWGDDEDSAHFYLENYVKFIDPAMLTRTGEKVIDAAD
jgi:small basic protein